MVTEKIMTMSTLTTSHISCYHCGNDCPDEPLLRDDKSFCCHGCRDVYTILSTTGLGNYYCYNDTPGTTRDKEAGRYEYLKEPAIIKDLIDYTDDRITIVTFYVPSIHCSSCIWLLEQLNKLNPAIYYSRVDFLKKQVNIRFLNTEINLHEVVETLDRIGYEPLISLQDVVKKQVFGKKDNLVKKIAVAGFCFGNVMLLSFPEYLGISGHEQSLKQFFGYLNLLFTLPVAFYSGRDYFTSAWANLRNTVLNIDVPLALGIAVLFIRSWIEVFTHTGAGFADTLCGLVFFLLIGRFVQQKTYYHLSFERDYRSFFPVAVQMVENEGERSLPLADLQVGQRIRIRNHEIIPADAILLKGDAKVDFSFVTGESVPVNKTLGEIIYAGGRQMGGAIELEVVKPVSQSYLTRLWNNEAFTRQQDNRIQTFNQRMSKYFTIVLLIIALGSFVFWAPLDISKAWPALTAVLIIACPCALALSTPFTMSAALGVFDKNSFYLKNAAVAEQMAQLDTIVFDKTGTVTINGSNNISVNQNISKRDRVIISSVCANSTHPLSRLICQYWGETERIAVDNYFELPGQGVSATVNGVSVKVGSAFFVTGYRQPIHPPNTTEVHMSIGSNYLGLFQIRHLYREGFENIRQLKSNYKLYLLSGDYGHEQASLSTVFENAMHFEQSPQQKLDFIKKLQAEGCKVMMIGDGLNDAGALKQSDVGVAITDDVNNFSPGSDAILDGCSLKKLPAFLKFSRSAMYVIYGSFLISLSYNLVGLSYAVTGRLSPLIAAILMPLSTVTIISFTSIATHLAARYRRLI